jgi:hypothetical protein
VRFRRVGLTSTTTVAPLLGHVISVTTLLSAALMYCSSTPGSVAEQLPASCTTAPAAGHAGAAQVMLGVAGHGLVLLLLPGGRGRRAMGPVLRGRRLCVGGQGHGRQAAGQTPPPCGCTPSPPAARTAEGVRSLVGVGAVRAVQARGLDLDHHPGAVAGARDLGHHAVISGVDVLQLHTGLRGRAAARQLHHGTGRGARRRGAGDVGRGRARVGGVACRMDIVHWARVCWLIADQGGPVLATVCLSRQAPPSQSQRPQTATHAGRRQTGTSSCRPAAVGTTPGRPRPRSRRRRGIAPRSRRCR